MRQLMQKVGMTMFLLVAIVWVGSADAVPQVALSVSKVRSAELPLGSAGMAAVEFDSFIYLIGGYTTSGSSRTALDSVLRYDAARDEILQIDSLPTALALAAHARDAMGTVYLFGGIDASGNASRAIHTYNLLDGTWTTLASKLPSPLSRGNAVLIDDAIYIIGGVNGASTSDSGSAGVLRFDLSTQAVTTVATLPLLADEVYTSAHYINLAYPDVAAPMPVLDPPEALGYIYIQSNQRRIRFAPSNASIVTNQLLGFDSGYMGEASVYLPQQQRIWFAGGLSFYDNFGSLEACYNSGIRGVDPTGLHSISYVAPLTTASYRMNDGAAVYLPVFDRVFYFGGFFVQDESCPTPFSDAPAEGDYNREIISVSPTYSSSDWSSTSGTPLAPDTITGSTVAGQSITVQVTNVNDESFALGLQAAFDTGNAVQMRALGEFAGTSATVTLPSDFLAGVDQRTVGLCVIPRSRFIPPNCREFDVTLVPGNVTGVLTADLSGSGGSGSEPADGVTVELIDLAGDLVASTTTNGAGVYDFCPSGDCLPIGDFTLNFYGQVASGDSYLVLPKGDAVAIAAGQTSRGDATLETATITGPTITRLSAEHDAVAGDAIGTFISFNNLSRVPAPEVLNTFTIEADAHYAQLQTTSVTFELGGVEVVDNSAEDGWSATFDMSQLNAGDNQLNITATNNADVAGDTRSFTVKAIAAKPLDASHIDVPSITWNPATKSYTTRILTPPNLRWPLNPPSVVDLYVLRLYTQARADIEIYETYRIDRSYEAFGDGAILAQFLSLDPDSYIVNQEFSVTARHASNGAINDYLISTEEYDICATTIAQQATVNIDGDDYKVCGDWIPVLSHGVDRSLGPVKVTGTLEASVQFGLGLRLQGALDGYDYTVSEIRIIPSPTLGVRGAVVLELDAGIGSLSGTGYIQGILDAEFPLVLNPDSASNMFLDDPCVQFLAQYGFQIEVDFGIFGSSEYESGPHNFPGSPVSLYGTCAQTRVTRSITPPENRRLPQPSASMNAAGEVLQVWIDSAGGDDSALFYNLDGASGIIHNGSGQNDPQVAFFDLNNAIAVWTETPDIAASDSGLDDYLLKQEIMTSFWDGNTWSAPTRLTSNGLSDGRAALAVRGDSALVTWVRESDTDFETKTDWQLVSRYWNGASWTSETVVADDANSADFEPTLAYRADGTNQAWLVWVRVADGDFDDGRKRKLTYATWNGSSWSNAIQPASWGTGGLHPSITFTPDSPRPLVAWVLPQAAAGSTDAPLMTTNNQLQLAWWGSSMSGWDVTSVEGEATWPQALTFDNDKALVILRNFGSADVTASQGNIGGVGVELLSTGLRAGPMGALTTDDDAIWQVGAVAQPLYVSGSGAGDVRLLGVREAASENRSRSPERWAVGADAPVRVSADSVARTLGGNSNTGVFEITPNTTGTDPAITDIDVSNVTPRNGETVTITATVRNLRLLPLSESGETQVTITLYDEQYNVLDTDALDGELLFNEAVVFPLAYISSGREETLFVEITNDGDSNSDNNQQFVTVGVLPELAQLQVSEVEPDVTVLQWSDGDGASPARYEVFARSAGRDGWTLVGTTGSTRYVVGGGYDEYAVQAVSAEGQRSSLSASINADTSTPTSVALQSSQQQPQAPIRKHITLIILTLALCTLWLRRSSNNP